MNVRLKRAKELMGYAVQLTKDEGLPTMVKRGAGFVRRRFFGKRARYLPGKKVFIKGNHDFWWSGITKLRDSAPDETFYFLQTDAVRIGNKVYAGSRGWSCPGSTDFSAEDEKLYRRECERFRLALNCGKALLEEGDELIALIHYPPFSLRSAESGFTELFEEYGVGKVIFGHLHGAGYFPLQTEKNGVKYYLTSCDKTNFSLTKIE